MDVIHTLWQALWYHDIAMLTNPSLIWTLYGILFVILFLENGALPAAFLPGDSLLLLVGVLVAKDAINYPLVIVILTAGASLGSWFGFLQGRWVGNTKIVQHWLSHIPTQYHQRAHNLFYSHGLAALFIGRFLAFVRTLLPMLAGISGLSSHRFQFFNWMSSFLWVGILTGLGYGLGKTKIFDLYEDQLMKGLILLPIVLLVLGLIGSIIVVWRKKYSAKLQ